MRKLIYSIMAITLFALLAGPALAESGDGDIESQDVTITVEDCLKWETCENPIEFFVACEDYPPDGPGFVYPSNLPTGRTSLDVWSNVSWNCEIWHDLYTIADPMPAAWTLQTAEDADYPGTWMSLDGTPTDYWAADQPATTHTQFIFNYKLLITSVPWPGVHTGGSVYYSVHTP